MKLVAIESGGDWADASVEYIVVPDDLDLEETYKEYNQWKLGNKWMSFDAWLKKYKGARDAENEIEVFYEG